MQQATKRTARERDPHADSITREFFAGSSMWVLAKKYNRTIAEVEAVVRGTIKGAFLARLRELREPRERRRG